VVDWWCYPPNPSGYVLRSEPEVENGRSSAKDGTPERLRCGIIQKELS